jgi:hypothetical protein
MSFTTTVVGAYPTFAGAEPVGTYERKVTISAKEAYVVWHGSANTEGVIAPEEASKEGLGSDAERLAVGLRETYGRFGWGSIEVCNLGAHKNELTIVMRHLPTPGPSSENGSECWHVRASIEVIVSAILAVKGTAFEVACKAVYRDHCEFKVSWE